MSLFGKRKLYKVVWRYDEFCSPSVDFVKATDAYKAWKKIVRKHAIHIEMVSVKEIKEEIFGRVN